jgi:hypothetical protein
MRKLGTIVAISAAVLALLAVALFRGCFDPGAFEVKSVVRSTSGKLAVVARRSDHQAMNSDEYFVIVANEVPSAHDLKFALHSSRPVFSTGAPCVEARWQDSAHLVISCREGSIKKSDINGFRHRIDDVVVLFDGIPVQ